MGTDRLLLLREVAALLGVHDDTVRRWGDAGTLLMVKTPGGHRRFPSSGVRAFLGEVQKSDGPTEVRVSVYCRVSSHDQKKKGDLERQIGRVSSHCAEKGYRIVEVLEDVGSGMSDSRPRLRKLFESVRDGKTDRVVIEHKDRLTRFNFGFLESFFKSYGVQIEWVNDVLGKSYEEELVGDILSLMASFSARIYGKRSADNRRRKTEQSGTAP